MPAAPPSAAVAESAPPPRDGSKDPFAKEVQTAAREYKSWPRVDERAGSAPDLCAYWPPVASVVRRSEPESGVAHGKKLYFLHASNLGAYTGLASSTADLPVGFTIVKESFRALELDGRTGALLEKNPELRLDAVGKFYRYGQWMLPITAEEASRYGLSTDEVSTQYMFEVPPAGRRAAKGRLDMRPPTAPPVRAIRVAGKWLRTGDQADLFVMTKVAKVDASGTDRGWVYGVVSADGSSVRQSGKLDHCVGCHDKAPHDRLFATAKVTPVDY